jgi:glycosyltransferase involved in cell wall biosynthesis
MSGIVDVALVSLGTTPGLRWVDDTFAGQLRAAGVTCEVRRARVGATGALRRNPVVTDLVEALAARRAARGAQARVTVFSTVTAALLQPARGPYAVRFDSPAVLNRTGWSGAWQRRRERAVLASARVLLPQSQAAGDAAPGSAPRVVVPVPINEFAAQETRDLDAVAYAGYPEKRGLDSICRAWAAAGDGRRLVVGGIDRARAVSWLERRGLSAPQGVEWAGSLPHDDWLATVGRAKLFLNASRWEDYGVSQLEALSAGAALVTVPSPGPYEALGLARRLAPDLVDQDLGAALTRALALGEAELARYRSDAADALAPYRPEAVQRVVAESVVPALGLAA